MMIKLKIAFTIIKYIFVQCAKRNVDVGLSYCLDNFNPSKRDLSDRP